MVQAGVRQRADNHRNLAVGPKFRCLGGLGGIKLCIKSMEVIENSAKYTPFEGWLHSNQPVNHCERLIVGLG
jgi:hypothetical protein